MGGRNSQTTCALLVEGNLFLACMTTLRIFLAAYLAFVFLINVVFCVSVGACCFS